MFGKLDGFLVWIFVCVLVVVLFLVAVSCFSSSFFGGRPSKRAAG